MVDSCAGVTKVMCELMPRSFDTTLGDGFPVTISYDTDTDGDIYDVTVYTRQGGICLDDLIYGTSLEDEAWERAIQNRPAPCARWLRENT